MGVQFTNVLLNLTHGDNGAFPDVNGAVIPGRVIPRSVKIEFHSTLDRILERTFVVCEIIPLAATGEVDGTTCLTYKSAKSVFLMEATSKQGVFLHFYYRAQFVVVMFKRCFSLDTILLIIDTRDNPLLYLILHCES